MKNRDEIVILNEKHIPSLNSEESLAITKLKSVLKSHFTLCDLVLFGSKARGDFERDSDTDILIVAKDPDDFNNRSKVSDIVFEINMEFNTLLSCILRNESKWESGIGEYTAFIEDVAKEGIHIEI